MRFMLADRGSVQDLERLSGRGFFFDLKVDGIRAMVELGGTGSQPRRLTMSSRNELDLTRRFPDLVESIRDLGDEALILDSEIAVPGTHGLPSWPLTQRRTAQSSPSAALVKELPAHLYVFDVLAISTQATASLPFTRRRELLEELATGWRRAVSVTACSRDAAAVWELVSEHHLEGVIAKAPLSRYRPGRSRDWVKIKATQSLTCLVGGVEWAGAEGMSDPRSLHLYLLDEAGELVQVGKASAGVSAPMRTQLLAGLQNPPLVVEVEFAEVTNSGVLRQPVIRRVRYDADVLACRTDQLSSRI
ncbi:MAG: hypothetical protein H0V49_10145 [Nocardioidaceae bacterium]|nr:hypothetical protein [Nocardioidaceae bacterium]